MLELATLGLLRRQPLHGYRLSKLLELFMGSCISVNYGAIYPLLRRLEQRGDISSLSIRKGKAGPSRVIYQITPQAETLVTVGLRKAPGKLGQQSDTVHGVVLFFLGI